MRIERLGWAVEGDKRSRSRPDVFLDDDDDDDDGREVSIEQVGLGGTSESEAHDEKEPRERGLSRLVPSSGSFIDRDDFLFRNGVFNKGGFCDGECLTSRFARAGEEKAGFLRSLRNGARGE